MLFGEVVGGPLMSNSDDGETIENNNCLQMTTSCGRRG